MADSLYVTFMLSLPRQSRASQRGSHNGPSFPLLEKLGGMHLDLCIITCSNGPDAPTSSVKDTHFAHTRPYVFPGDSFSQKRSSLVIPYSKAPSIYQGKEAQCDKSVIWSVPRTSKMKPVLQETTQPPQPMRAEHFPTLCTSL
jgi:hypothetical protein